MSIPCSQCDYYKVSSVYGSVRCSGGYACGAFWPIDAMFQRNYTTLQCGAYRAQEVPCSWCYVRSDAGGVRSCPTNRWNPCSCNSTCNLHKSTTSAIPCNNACYALYNVTWCSACDGTCNGYSCTCNGRCDGYACPCNSSCDAYSGCSTCNGCNAYQQCSASCDVGCYQQNCAQCNQRCYTDVFLEG